MQYKIGDKVRIHKNLMYYRKKYKWTAYSRFKENEEVTITDCNKNMDFGDGIISDGYQIENKDGYKFGFPENCIKNNREEKLKRILNEI